MRRKAIHLSNLSEMTNPKRNKIRRRVLKTVRSLLKIMSKRVESVQIKPRKRGRPPKPKAEERASNPDDEGVTFKQIETWFKRKWSDQRGESPDIQAAIDEEVAGGRLVVLPNRKYALKNWRVSVKAITQPSRSTENGLSEEEKGGGVYQETLDVAEGEIREEAREVKNSTSSSVHSCVFAGEDDDDDDGDPSLALPVNDGEQTNKRKSLGNPHPLSLVKKFKLENGDDIRLITSEGSDAKAENVCGTCDMTAQCNPSGQPEPLLTCKDCNISFHPSCLSYPKELAERASKFPWECASCKTCVVCGDAEEEQMLICDSCDRGYHTQCHDPVVNDKISSDEWLCSSCMNDSAESGRVELGECSGNGVEEKIKVSGVNAETSSGNKNQASNSDKQGSESVGSQLLPTPNSSPSRTGETEEEPKNLSTIDFPLLPKLILSVPGDPPNATNWTVEDVHAYFTKAGFSLQAETFKNEEIDGRALLLLTRPDVLSGMKFKLGPALKIYAHIQRIQESSFNE